jgi:hypothetical protein
VKGLSKRTTKLGFNILRLHYSCDPDKDPSTPVGRKWYVEARKGMSDARWRQEYEIDYGALGGQLVFPEWDDAIHMAEPCWPLDRLSCSVWQITDPHPRKHHAFLWLGVNSLGEQAVVWSWFKPGPGKLISEYCAVVRAIEASAALGISPDRRLMDIAAKSFNASENVDYFQAYRDARNRKNERVGLNYSPAKKNREYAGYELIREALKPREFELDGEKIVKPTLTVWAGCGDNDELAWQMRNLRYREWRGQVLDKDAPKDPMEKRRDLVDCLSYGLMDNPRFFEGPGRAEDDDPNVVIAADSDEDHASKSREPQYTHYSDEDWDEP